MVLKNYSWNELKSICEKEQKKLIFWGAGRQYQSFVTAYPESGRYTAAVADGASGKWGKRVCCGVYAIEIVSIEQMLKLQIKNCIVILSCLDAATVYERLGRYRELEETECCILHFVRGKTEEEEEKNRYYPGTFRISREQKIPKVIHYCWFGKQPIPEKNKMWMESWKKYCPDYEIIEWNESNYDIHKSPFMERAYEQKKWGFVPDYARLDIIWRYGGIYLDTDVELVRSPDDLLYQEAYMGMEASKCINPGSGFGAKKGKRLIREMLSLYETCTFDEKTSLPSPAMMNSFFRQKGFVSNGSFQILEENMTVYPPGVLAGKNLYTGRVCLTEHTYSIHHYDASWQENARHDMKRKLQVLYRQCMAAESDSKQQQNIQT